MIVRIIRYLTLTVTILMLATSPGCFSKAQRPAFYTMSDSLVDDFTISKLDPLTGTSDVWKKDNVYYLRDPVLSPDGQRVSYFKCIYDEVCDLWVAEANGRDERFLAGPFLPLLYAPPLSPQWSADGRHIAFRASMPESQKKEGLYVLSASSGRVVHSLVGRISFVWAPASPRIALIWQDREPLKNGLYIFDVESGAEDFVLPNHTERLLTEVMWLTDEEHVLVVAFNTGRPSNERIYLVSIDDGSFEEIPVHSADEALERYTYHLCIAPDGQRFAFKLSYDNSTEQGIVVMDLDTGDEQWIETPVGGNIAWSPDSKHILFDCISHSLPNEICLVSLDDGKISEIVVSKDQWIMDISW